MAIDVYEHYLNIDDSGKIQANVLYTVVNDQIIGCYSGYAGGNQDYRFFYVNADRDECIVSDDEYEFDESFASFFQELQSKRSDFEKWDDEDEDDGSYPSEIGLQFLGSSNSENATENFDYDILRLVQDEWTLHLYID